MVLKEKLRNIQHVLAKSLIGKLKSSKLSQSEILNVSKTMTEMIEDKECLRMIVFEQILQELVAIILDPFAPNIEHVYYILNVFIKYNQDYM